LSAKYRLFELAFRTIAATGADRALRSWTQGRGAILTLHQVRPWRPRGFAPNRMLEVTPEFLDLTITRARQAGFVFVRLDEVLDRLRDETSEPFLCLTFDDGYRDTLEHALPVLRRHGTPATVFLTPGFIERTAPLWWLDLEEALRRADNVEANLGEGGHLLSCADDAARSAAFATIYRALRSGPEQRLQEVIGGLARRSGVDSAGVAAEQCLDWAGVKQLAAEPLIDIGAHTMTHPMLAKHTLSDAQRELEQSRSVLAERLGRKVRHVAYPVGDAASAGAREFRLAGDLGFETGVTTRPGMLFPAHAGHPMALPRLSLNGCFQTARHLDILLAGLPSLLWNRGRRLSVA
jgi:peptidoglycan/xylan/chitin deacetylase (PgdA/CDA1 family)